MYCITNEQLADISGGNNYIDMDTWKHFNNKAILHGIALSGFVTPILTGVVLGLTDSYGTAAKFFLGVAPYIAIAGYANSNSFSDLQQRV